MTQQTPVNTSVSNAGVAPQIALPFEVVQTASQATKTLESAQGAISGIDTQAERTDLITKVKDYFEGGLINGAGLVIGIIFVIAGMYLLFLEFKASPSNRTQTKGARGDATRVYKDVQSRRRKSATSKQTATVKQRKTAARARRAQYERERQAGRAGVGDE